MFAQTWRIRSRFCLLVPVILIPVLGCGCAWYGFGDTRKDEMTQKLTEQGLRSEAEGDLSQATKSFSEAAEADRADVAARLELARIHRKSGRNQAAIQTLQEVVQLTPDDSQAWHELGELYFEEKQYVAANQSFNQAIRNDPSLIPALMYLAELEEIREYDDQALEYYHRVLAIDDDFIPAMLRIARIQLKQDESIRAALILRSVCYCSGARPGEIAEARWLLGLAYGNQNRWSDAAKSLEIAMQIHLSPGPEDLYYLAYAQYKAGDLVAASQTTDRLLELDPASQSAALLQRRIAETMPPNSAPIRAVTVSTSVEPPPPAGWKHLSGSTRVTDL